MLKRFLSSPIICALFLVFISCKKEDDAVAPVEYTLNQDIFLPSENGDSARLSDPHIIKVDNKWYLYGTGNPFRGYECWSTDDLVTWSYEGYVWEATPGSWNDKQRFLAPDIFQGDDGFYLYYSADGKIGVAYSTSPTGPFQEVYDHPFVGGGYGGVGDGIYLTDYNVDDWTTTIIDYEEYAIDAHVFRASDGSLTLYFAAMKPFGYIAALPLSDPVTLAANRPVNIIETDLLSWEGIGIEAPFMIERNGTFHLMYSGGFHPTPNYAVGVATSKSPLGPFTKRSDNPILRQSAQFNLLASAHNSAVQGKYNDWLIFFHSRDWGQNNNSLTRTRYLRMHFDNSGQIKVEKVMPKY